VLPLRLVLLRLVSRQPRDRTAHSAPYTIANALAEVTQLALSLLSLSLLVLTRTLLLQAIGAE